MDRGANVAIARQLIEHSEVVAKATGLPLFTCYSPAQRGETFGIRLANAMESVFDFGFERVIAIGNDCPKVTTKLLQATADQLNNTPIVLGPAMDGGVYLIGINREVYQRKQFVKLPWETANLQKGWSQYQQAIAAEVKWLSALADIDDAADFKQVIYNLPRWHLLRKSFTRFVVSQQTLFFKYLPNSSAFHFLDCPLRAPPVTG